MFNLFEVIKYATIFALCLVFLSPDYGHAAILPVIVPPTDIPEPTTLAIMGLGLVGLGVARRKKAA